MAHGRVLRGLGVLLSGLAIVLIPFVGQVFVLNMAYRVGKSGNEIAATSRMFQDDEHFVAVQNAWRNWGIPIFAVTWLAVIGWFVLVWFYSIR
jgi:hypothetical protein